MANTQRTEERERREARVGAKKKYIRKEKETSGASCIYYGGLTAIAVRVADTRRNPRPPGFNVLLGRERKKTVLSLTAREGRYVFA